MDAGQSPRILVAVRPQVKDIVFRLLNPEFQLTFCHTVNDAKLLLGQQRFDVVFCSLQFDGSQVFELLKYVKSCSSCGEPMFVTGAVTYSIIGLDAVTSVLNATRLVGADACLNLHQWQQEIGEEAASEKFRSILHELCRSR